MAKHILFIAFLATLVLFIAHTTASRDEQEEICHQQLKSLNLNPCEKHLMKRIQKDEDEDEQEDVLKMRGINYIRNHHKESLKEKCCAQLMEVNMMDCTCQALKEIMENLSDQLHKSQLDDLEEELTNLPKRCGMSPPSGCDLDE